MQIEMQRDTLEDYDRASLSDMKYHSISRLRSHLSFKAAKSFPALVGEGDSQLQF